MLPEKRIAGTAVTVRLPHADSTILHYLTKLMRPGDFIVVDRCGDDKHACWGGVVTHSMKLGGIVGAVIHGPAGRHQPVGGTGTPRADLGTAAGRLPADFQRHGGHRHRLERPRAGLCGSRRQQARRLEAFWTSLSFAAIVTALSIVIAVPAAWVMTRLTFTGRDLLFNLFTAPLLLPTIVLGLAILIVFASFGLLATMHDLVFAHLVVTLPYALRVLAVSLSTQDRACEEEARTLGAKPLTVFFRVPMPMLTPGLVAAAALCFLVSFDEVVITLFLTGPASARCPSSSTTTSITRPMLPRHF